MDNRTDEKKPHGLTIVYTGSGKGKTTASLGQALRALGHGFRVCVIQFIKGEWPTGESKAFKQYLGVSEFHTVGSGFTWKSDREEVQQAASAGLKLARQKIMDGGFDMVVLDELTYLLTYKLVDETEILSLIRDRPKGQHLVISGRNASPALIEAADLVTRMEEVKHPYAAGMSAQKGIEF